jgi:hypothetical protein
LATQARHSQVIAGLMPDQHAKKPYPDNEKTNNLLIQLFFCCFQIPLSSASG